MVDRNFVCGTLKSQYSQSLFHLTFDFPVSVVQVIDLKSLVTYRYFFFLTKHCSTKINPRPQSSQKEKKLWSGLCVSYLLRTSHYHSSEARPLRNWKQDPTRCVNEHFYDTCSHSAVGQIDDTDHIFSLCCNQSLIRSQIIGFKINHVGGIFRCSFYPETNRFLLKLIIALQDFTLLETCKRRFI